ncbi:MAG: hypothetical protein ACRDMV_02200 [Streptosporangiales bacterium]
MSYCGSADREPTLSLSSTPQLGMQSWYSMTSHRLGDRSQLRVNNDSGDAVIRAQDPTDQGRGPRPDRRPVKLRRLSDDRYDYVAPSGAVFGTFVRKPSDPIHFHAPRPSGSTPT